jgi:hypothetical protein
MEVDSHLRPPAALKKEPPVSCGEEVDPSARLGVITKMKTQVPVGK